MQKEYLEWLKKLIEEDNLEKFYHNAQWIRVSKEVRKMDHRECQPCKRAGRVTTVDTLNEDGKPIQMSAHHWKEVKVYPELALSIWYVDADGKRKRNIEYVCEACHNKIHHKYSNPEKNNFLNEERW